MTFSEPTSPPDIEGLHLDRPMDLLESERNTCETIPPDDDRYISQFLRSPSPPLSSAKASGDDDCSNTRTVLHPEGVEYSLPVLSCARACRGINSLLFHSQAHADGTCSKNSKSGPVDDEAENVTAGSLSCTGLACQGFP